MILSDVNEASSMKVEAVAQAIWSSQILILYVGEKKNQSSVPNGDRDPNPRVQRSSRKLGEDKDAQI